MGTTITATKVREFLNKNEHAFPLWEQLLNSQDRAVANFLVSTKLLTKTKLPAEECGHEQNIDWSNEYFYVEVE